MRACVQNLRRIPYEPLDEEARKNCAGENRAAIWRILQFRSHGLAKMIRGRGAGPERRALSHGARRAALRKVGGSGGDVRPAAFPEMIASMRGRSLIAARAAITQQENHMEKRNPNHGRGCRCEGRSESSHEAAESPSRAEPKTDVKAVTGRCPPAAADLEQC